MRFFALSSMIAMVLALAAAPARADFLIGLAAVNEFMGTNLEWAGEESSTYVVLGAYQAKTGYEIESLTGIVGHRRYAGGSFHKSTFFGGFYIGDLDGGPAYNRFGAGGEVGYQWLKENLRITAQAGLAILEPEDLGATATEPEPQSLIGVSASLRY